MQTPKAAALPQRPLWARIREFKYSRANKGGLASERIGSHSIRSPFLQSEQRPLLSSCMKSRLLLKTLPRLSMRQPFHAFPKEHALRGQVGTHPPRGSLARQNAVSVGRKSNKSQDLCTVKGCIPIASLRGMRGA